MQRGNRCDVLGSNIVYTAIKQSNAMAAATHNITERVRADILDKQIVQYRKRRCDQADGDGYHNPQLCVLAVAECLVVVAVGIVA